MDKNDTQKQVQAEHDFAVFQRGIIRDLTPDKDGNCVRQAYAVHLAAGIHAVYFRFDSAQHPFTHGEKSLKQSTARSLNTQAFTVPGSDGKRKASVSIRVWSPQESTDAVKVARSDDSPAADAVAPALS